MLGLALSSLELAQGILFHARSVSQVNNRQVGKGRVGLGLTGVTFLMLLALMPLSPACLESIAASLIKLEGEIRIVIVNVDILRHERG